MPLLRTLSPAAGLAVLLLTAVVPTRGASAAPEIPTAPECLTSGRGERACGYGCISAYGEVRCARTPEGVCTAAADLLACWDPPPFVKAAWTARFARQAPLPKASCITSAGKTACGYHCVRGFDQVQCADTPWGVCRPGDGALRCWDPSPALLASLREGQRLPEAICSAVSGKLACGYHCAATGGEVACTETPDGICRADQDRVTCFDPPLEARLSVPLPSSPASVDATTGRGAGHHCVVGRDRTACAVSARGVCLEEKGTLSCR